MIKHNSVRIITYFSYTTIPRNAKGEACGMEQRATAIGATQSQSTIIFFQLNISLTNVATKCFPGNFRKKLADNFFLLRG